MSEPGDINFDDLKPEEFEQYLPELFASSEARSARIRACKSSTPLIPIASHSSATSKPSPKPPAASSIRSKTQATKSGPTSRTSSAKDPPSSIPKMAKRASARSISSTNPLQAASRPV